MAVVCAPKMPVVSCAGIALARCSCIHSTGSPLLPLAQFGKVGVRASRWSAARAARRAWSSRGGGFPASPRRTARSRRSRRPPRGSAAVRRWRRRRRSARAGRSGGRRCGWRCRCWHRRVDRDADVLPVHLRRVVLRSVGPEEHRVGEGGVVGDVREGGEAQRVGRPDLRAQVGDVGLRGGVVAFVLGLGVDHEAVGARWRPPWRRGSASPAGLVP